MVDSIVNCFRNGFNKIFNRAKETIRLRVDTPSYNDQDDPNPEFNTSNIDAIVQVVSVDDAQESLGELSVGDAFIFVKQDVSIANGNYVLWDDNWYEIKKVTRERTGGSELFIECYCQKDSYLSMLHKTSLTDNMTFVDTRKTGWLKELPESISFTPVLLKNTSKSQIDSLFVTDTSPRLLNKSLPNESIALADSVISVRALILNESIIFDDTIPWEITDAHDYSLNSSTLRSDNNNDNSVEFTANVNCDVIYITKHSSCDATKGVICNSVNTIIATATFSGDVATFAVPVALTSGNTYFASAGKDTAQFTVRYIVGSSARSRINIDFTGGGYWRGFYYTDRMANILSVTTSVVTT